MSSTRQFVPLIEASEPRRSELIAAHAGADGAERDTNSATSAPAGLNLVACTSEGRPLELRELLRVGKLAGD